MEQLIQQLKVILGTNFALYFKAHGFHWNVEGVNFQQYHDFFAELYTSIFNNNTTMNNIPNRFLIELEFIQNLANPNYLHCKLYVLLLLLLFMY